VQANSVGHRHFLLWCIDPHRLRDGLDLSNRSLLA
jgi:hypothetical protein